VRVREASAGLAVVVGYVDAVEDIYNTAAVKVGIEVESIA